VPTPAAAKLKAAVEKSVLTRAFIVSSLFLEQENVGERARVPEINSHAASHEAKPAEKSDAVGN